MNVGILVFPDVEILDFTGPFEVFRPVPPGRSHPPRLSVLQVGGSPVMGRQAPAPRSGSRARAAERARRYAVQARQLEPLGVIYIWPETN